MKYILILFGICLTLTIVWFHKGTILGGGDAGFAFYSPTVTLNFSKTSWVEYGTGASTIGWLPSLSLLYFYSFWEKIGIPTTILQASYFFILMYVGVLSIYFLSLLHLSKKYQLISFITAVFYLFNPFTMSQIWARGILPQQTAFALLPLAILLFDLGIKRKSLVYSILLVLVSLIFSTAFSFLTFIIVFWLMLLILLLFNLTRFSVLFFTITFLLWIVVHAWWFIPLFSSSGSIYSAGITGSEENLGTLLGVSRNFTPEILIRLLQRTYFYDPSAFSKVFVSLPFQLISWLPFIFMAFGLFKIIKNRLWEFKIFVFLLILGMIISLGANPPFGLIFANFFNHFPVLQAFRNPFEKFGLVYVLGYCPVFAYGLVSFFNNKKYRNLVIVLVLFLTCGIFAWPMWTGRVVAGPDKKIGLSVPPYYKELKAWLGENSRDYRVFMTPLWSGDGAFYQWGNGGRYQGSDPMIWILDHPSISNTLLTPFYYDFISGMRKYMERMNLAPSLALLRAKFLVDREDAIMLTDREKEHRKFLTESIYPPLGKDSNKQKICQDQYATSRANDTTWIMCQIPNKEGDWSKIRYAHFVVTTDVPSYLEIAMRDREGTRIRWYGSSGAEYQADSNDGMIATITLSAPTEYNPAINFSQVDLIEILAHPKDSPKGSAGQIFLKEIILDSGREDKLNTFNPVGSFGSLKVFEPLKFNPPPEYGILSSLAQVKDIAGLFESSEKSSDQLAKMGFLVISQNSNKNLQLLPERSDVYVLDKQKISSTRYWLNLQIESSGFVLLSKTFNPDWKLIPAVALDELSGNLFDDLKLLGMSSIDENKHFVANGYANLWIVDGSDQEYAIIYKPQIIADIGAKVSKYTVYLLSGIISFYIIKKYVKKIP